MFTFTDSTERIFAPAQCRVDMPSSPQPTDPPPIPPSSTETSLSSEDLALLQTLRFPEYDESDNAGIDDGDGTEPIDLSQGFQWAGLSSQCTMDPFRGALFSPIQPLSHMPSAVPGDVREMARESETRLMSMFSLLRLLHFLSTEPEENKSQVIEVNGRDDQVLESLLDEERRAEEDEYIEESHFSIQRTQYQTRGTTDGQDNVTSTTTTSSTNITQTTPTTSAPPTAAAAVAEDTSTPSSSSSSSSSSSFSLAEDSPDPTLFLSDNDENLESITLISHPRFTSDEEEFRITNQIDNGIGSIIGTLPRAFVYFMNHLLPKTTLDIPRQVLPRLKWFFSPQFRTDSESLLPSLTEDFQRLDNGMPQDRIASQIIKVLLFSSCSESSCERIFSRARFIVGKRRYQLSRRSLFSSLLVSDLALKSFLEEHSLQLS